MDPNAYEHDQIVVSKEITPASSKNTYGINKSDLTETSSQKSALSKNGEEIKSLIQSDDTNVETLKVVGENISSGNGIVLSDNNELFHTEEEENVCDTCGDIGCPNLLVICSKCSVGAEHTYCMMVKAVEVPQKWFCYDCIQNKDEMRERKENEETNTRKRKADCFEMEEKPSLQRHDLLNIDLNRNLNIDLNMDPENEDGQSAKRYCVDTKLSL